MIENRKKKKKQQSKTGKKHKTQENRKGAASRHNKGVWPTRSALESMSKVARKRDRLIRKRAQSIAMNGLSDSDSDSTGMY